MYAKILLVGALIVSALAGHYCPPGSWWRPTPGTSWQWCLCGPELMPTNADSQMYSFDLHLQPQSVIDDLHSRGIVAICYFSWGTFEPIRPDASRYTPEVLGVQYQDGYPDEIWVDVTSELVKNITLERLDFAVSKNCDGIEADNIDVWYYENGFNITYEQNIEMLRWLTDEMHKRGLSAAHKNNMYMITDTQPLFDFAINEQCVQYKECPLLMPFIENNKAVFGVEYNGDPTVFCPQVNERNFDWMKKTPNFSPMTSHVECRNYSRPFPSASNFCFSPTGGIPTTALPETTTAPLTTTAAPATTAVPTTHEIETTALSTTEAPITSVADPTTTSAAEPTAGHDTAGGQVTVSPPPAAPTTTAQASTSQQHTTQSEQPTTALPTNPTSTVTTQSPPHTSSASLVSFSFGWLVVVLGTLHYLM